MRLDIILCSERPYLYWCYNGSSMSTELQQSCSLIPAVDPPVANSSTVGCASAGIWSTGKPLPITGLTDTSAPAPRPAQDSEQKQGHNRDVSAGMLASWHAGKVQPITGLTDTSAPAPRPTQDSKHSIL
jgi:hypothetical protein